MARLGQNQLLAAPAIDTPSRFSCRGIGLQLVMTRWAAQPCATTNQARHLQVRLQPGPAQTEAGLQIGQGAGHGQPLVLKFRALVPGEGLGLVEAEGLNTSLAESCPERDSQGRGLRPLFIQGHWTPGVWVGLQQGWPDGGRGSRELRPRRRGCQQLVQQLDFLVELGSGALQLAGMPASRTAGWGCGAARAALKLLAKLTANRPGAWKLRKTISGAWPASGAFVEPGRAGLAQSRHHGCCQVAQAGERVLPQERR